MSATSKHGTTLILFFYFQRKWKFNKSNVVYRGVCSYRQRWTRHHSGRNVVDSRGNKLWPQWWRVSLSVRVHTTLNLNINERNLFQDLVTIENTDSDLKVHARHYGNELRVRLAFQKLLHTCSTCRNNTKKCLGKEYWRVLVVDKSTDHEKRHFDLFFSQLKVFSGRELNKALRDTLDSYRQWQISRSDCEISCTCGKKD